jgi:hypothetical protein
VATEQTEPQAQAEAITQLRELIQRARKGDAKALPRLRQYLDRSPALWQQTGNIALQTQMALFDAICGRDLLLRECMARQINGLKAELSGDSPSAMEKLAIERIITVFLQLGYAEAREAQKPEASLQWAKFALERQDRANRQLVIAMNTLANLRKLSRPINVEIHQTPTVHQAMPIIAGLVNGDQDGVNGLLTTRLGKMPANGSAKPINGVNRINGKLNGYHNQPEELLTPTTAK